MLGNIKPKGGHPVKKAISMLMVFAFVVTSAGVVFAADKGNKRKGKYTYRKVYKSCHQRGRVNSETPSLSPNSKTQADWVKVFDKKEFAEFGCKEEWDKLSDKDLLDIFSYLHAIRPIRCRASK
jgi:hypothetical protein